MSSLYVSKWKLYFMLLLCSSVLLFSFVGVMPEKLRGFLPVWLQEQKVILGLDLQGGSHMLLEIDSTALFEERYSILRDSIKKVMRSSNVKYMGMSSASDGVRFALKDLGDAAKVAQVIDTLNKQRDDNTEYLLVHVEKDKVHLEFHDKAVSAIKDAALKKSIEKIRRRVDETGTKEPVIRSQGTDRIILQLAGVFDPQHLKNILGQTAKLSFHMVETTLHESQLAAYVLPHGSEIIEGSHRASGESGEKMYYVVDKRAVIGGDCLVDARPSFDQNGSAQINFEMNSFGAQLFAQITTENVGKQFAIVLDRRVLTAPVINETIPNGTGRITGDFAIQEAQDLSLLMRSGALPVPLKVLEERTIGPGLGADSVKQGTQATIIAIVAVAIFMLLAYSWFGIFADIAVIFNIIFLIAAIVILGATLTLPGIAGIALTVGMAVDANVLINERIKEEYRSGVKLIKAIDTGYKKAMSTIIDSNLTTLIGSFILYECGTGPVRGFAVTLILGILISLFTAISLSRVFVGIWLRWSAPKQLAI